MDFIGGGGSFGGQGLLVSENALRVLEGLKLPPHQHYAVDVVHRGTHLDESEGLGDPVKIGSASELRDLIEARKGDFWIYYSKTTLNSAYARAAFDLFYLEWLGGPSSSAPLLSERGKSALEREKLA